MRGGPCCCARHWYRTEAWNIAASRATSTTARAASDTRTHPTSGRVSIRHPPFRVRPPTPASISGLGRRPRQESGRSYRMVRGGRAFGNALPRLGHWQSITRRSSISEHPPLSGSLIGHRQYLLPHRLAESPLGNSGSDPREEPRSRSCSEQQDEAAAPAAESALRRAQHPGR